MILDQFLVDLVARGGLFRVENDRLIFRGPPGSLAACDEEFIRDNRAELLEMVRSAGVIEPVLDENLPAWFDDESLMIRSAGARASVEHHLASLRAEARPARSTDRGRRFDRPTTPTSQHQAFEEPNDQEGGDPDGQVKVRQTALP